MIQFYKPQKSCNGAAFSFKLGLSGKDPCVYINAIQQFSWNEATKNGSFSENAKNPEKTLAVKLNEFELGGIINAIENEAEFSAFHTFDENKTQLSFKPYSKQNGAKAFSFTVTKNSSLKIGIGLEVSEAYALREFLRFALTELYRTRVENSNA